ncbi:hypothetical protein BDW22DRAFT_1358371 [Trametopsis cervina]|nr:hypothetical protein BDW22DRAFT_1358371 [Trametopsis cervina]
MDSGTAAADLEPPRTTVRSSYPTRRQLSISIYNASQCLRMYVRPGQAVTSYRAANLNSQATPPRSGPDSARAYQDKATQCQLIFLANMCERVDGHRSRCEQLLVNLGPTPRIFRIPIVRAMS